MLSEELLRFALDANTGAAVIHAYSASPNAIDDLSVSLVRDVTSNRPVRNVFCDIVLAGSKAIVASFSIIDRRRSSRRYRPVPQIVLWRH